MRSPLTLLLVALLSACDMRDQGRIKPLEPTPFFADNRSARSLVPGTVPRTGIPTTEAMRRQDFSGVTELPVALTLALLRNGKQSYDIFCSPCHGLTGAGDGMIVRRGFVPPPSFHLERLRQAPVGHFVDVITNGYGAMYSYRDRVPLEERWAVAAYIRALQLSRRAPRELLTAEELRRAEEGGP